MTGRLDEQELFVYGCRMLLPGFIPGVGVGTLASGMLWNLWPFSKVFATIVALGVAVLGTRLWSAP